jgi:hypothetical protein
MFIYDPWDKTGFGMYSQAGRSTIVKHEIFKKREEILKNKPRKMVVKLVNTLPVRLSPIDYEKYWIRVMS